MTLETTDLAGGRGWLADGPAASVHRIDAALGRLLQISDAGRTSEREWHLWNLYFTPDGRTRPASQRPSWLGRPGYPGTSPHGRGEAIDTDEHRTNLALLQEHGWRRTVMPSEPWHFVYNPSLDKHRNAPAGTGAAITPSPLSPEEDDMVFLLATSIDDVNPGFNRWICDGAAGTMRNVDKDEWEFQRKLGVPDPEPGVQPSDRLTKRGYRQIW